MGKNANGQGSIRQRKDGRWEARFTYYDEYGSRKSGSVYAITQSECRKKLTAKLKSIDDGNLIKKATRYTVKQWTDEWLDVYCQSIKASSLVVYRQNIECYVTPRIGNVKLATVTQSQIQRLYNNISKEVSVSRARMLNSIMHSCFSKAVQLGYISQNPTNGVVFAKTEKTRCNHSRMMM